MISVRQWIISALGLLTIVTFCTYQLFGVQVPRSMERGEWAVSYTHLRAHET